MLSENVERAIQDLRKGKFILVYDSGGREKETDLVIASQYVTPVAIRTMRKDGGGLIFMMVHPAIWEKLQLPYLADLFYECNKKHPVFNALIPNDIPYDTKSSFSLTINHRRTFTGISDIDRAMTISEFAKLANEIQPLEDGNAINLFGQRFRSPGHVPICSASKNVLNERFGHTELSVGLLEMANLTPVATGCEMLGNDGKSLSKEVALKYGKKHDLVFLEGNEILGAWKSYQSIRGELSNIKRDT